MTTLEVIVIATFLHKFLVQISLACVTPITPGNGQ